MTTIASGPADPSPTQDASFTFSADQAGSTFECSVDGAAYGSCPASQASSNAGRNQTQAAR